MRKKLQNLRWLGSLMLAVVFIILISSQRSDDIFAREGIPDKEFWKMKQRWGGAADIVFAGASRIGRGLDPSEFEKVFHGSTVLNYFFNNNIYSNQYFERLASVFKKESKQKILVLAAFPPLFAGRAEAWGNAFLQTLQEAGKKEPQSVFQIFGRMANQKRDFLLYNCRPFTLTLIKTERAHKEYLVNHMNGWTEAYHIPYFSKSRRDNALKVIKKLCQQSVSPEKLLDNLDKHIKNWKAEGIKVFFFRPPTCDATVQIEDNVCLLDMEVFKARILESGAHWIDVDNVYHSYDCLHLMNSAAKDLSRDFALLLKERIKELR